MPTPSLQIYHYADMKGGWIAGKFRPTAFYTPHFEVALKRHRQGEPWAAHYQRVATEINLVLSGILELNGQKFHRDDIIVVPPMLVTKPVFVTDCQVMCIKVPSLPNDKVLTP